MYKARNSRLSYDPTLLSTKRIITQPSIPKHNGGVDNENYDLILRVNDVIGSSVADEKEKWSCLQRGSRYRITRVLGHGTFGQVAKCWDETHKRVVAVKVLKNKLPYFRQGLLEIGILTAINSNCDRDKKNHCLRLLDHFIYKNHLCIVNELLGVNVYEMMRSGGFSTITVGTIRSYLRQTLKALSALEAHGVVHCDLKPENIMLDGPRGENVTLIDFGSACFSGNTVFTYIQSRHYRAPEVILESGYSCPIDMWSLGCVAAEFFIGHPLFPGSSEYNQLYKITQLIGDVPTEMLENSRKMSKFYNRVEGGYVLKTSKEFAESYQSPQDSDESGMAANTDKMYLPVKSLEELVNKATIRTDPGDRFEKSPMELRELLLDFLEKTLTIDPHRRMTASAALRHPFITGKRQQAPPQDLMFPVSAIMAAHPARPRQSQELQMKPQIEGCFTEIYSTFCRYMYDEDIVVDSSSGITLVKLETPIVPRRDATQVDERIALKKAAGGRNKDAPEDSDEMDPQKKIMDAYKTNQLQFAYYENEWREMKNARDDASSQDSFLFAKDKTKLISNSSTPKATQKRKKYDVSSLLKDLK